MNICIYIIYVYFIYKWYSLKGLHVLCMNNCMIFEYLCEFASEVSLSLNYFKVMLQFKTKLKAGG